MGVAKTDLKKVLVVRSPTTGTIYVARYGKDPTLALDKREAKQEVLAAVVEHILEIGPSGVPKASGGVVVSFGRRRFKIVVTTLKDGEA